MPDKVEYRILNVPLIGTNVAASRVPRLQVKVPAEFGEMLSAEVARGEWTIAENGEPLHVSGATIPERLEFKISTRDFWLMPVAVADAADETWTSGSLTKQGVRLKELEKSCGSKAAALVLLTEEAALYGVKPFTTEIGVKRGDT